MGKTDRLLRTGVGIAILAAGLATQSLWGLLALVPLGTAAVGFCPLYPIFGISTVKKIG